MKRFKVRNLSTNELKTIEVSDEEIEDERNLSFLHDYDMPEVIAMVKAMGGDNIVEFALENDNTGVSEKNIKDFIKEWKMYVAEMNDEDFDEDEWDGKLDEDWGADFVETGLCDDIYMMFEDDWEMEE